MHDDNFTKRMRGEFRGDFTRDTFDPDRHYSRVLMQQGRVQLDSDWNEQVSIFTNDIRTLICGIIGPHAAPRDPQYGDMGTESFRVKPEPDDEPKRFYVAQGCYYVNGLLCHNAGDHYPVDEDFRFDSDQDYLVYLDVFERHVNAIQDDSIREKALGGPDTCSRAEIIWQVKWIKHEDLVKAGVADDVADIAEINFKKEYVGFLDALKKANRVYPGTGRLSAKAKENVDDSDPCLTAPEAKYRGVENQLYRVEIHRGGSIPDMENDATGMTFKWSRENASVNFRIIAINENKITLADMGRDERFGLKRNDWVEIVYDDSSLLSDPTDLVRIQEIDNEEFTVTLETASPLDFTTVKHKHPYLRRWDQSSGTASGISVSGGATDETDWIELEDGVQVQFLKHAEDGTTSIYQTGDYWIIPARVATGDVEWPSSDDKPVKLQAHGVKHYYAPLANIRVDSNLNLSRTNDFRRKVNQQWS